MVNTWRERFFQLKHSMTLILRIVFLKFESRTKLYLENEQSEWILLNVCLVKYTTIDKEDYRVEKFYSKIVFRIVNRCIATRQPRTTFYSSHPFFLTNNCLSSPFSIHQLQSLAPFISFSPPHSIDES